MITVLIAEDNAFFNLSLSSYLTKEKDIKIIDMCMDGKTALASYLRNKPDIMLLDLNLPYLNGLQILDYLDSLEEEKQANIIVISGNTKYRNRLTTLSNVYCVLDKPCDNNVILQKIREIKKYSTYMDSLKVSVFNYLQRLNFNMNSIGTIYLAEMILMDYNNKSSYNLKSLIHKISLKKNINDTAVKSAVYHAVDTMNRFIDTDTLKEVCPTGKKITASDVISISKFVL